MHCSLVTFGITVKIFKGQNRKQIQKNLTMPFYTIVLRINILFVFIACLQTIKIERRHDAAVPFIELNIYTTKINSSI